jgi:hypothetical protein
MEIVLGLPESLAPVQPLLRHCSHNRCPTCLRVSSWSAEKAWSCKWSLGHRPPRHVRNCGLYAVELPDRHHRNSNFTSDPVLDLSSLQTPESLSTLYNLPPVTMNHLPQAWGRVCEIRID